MIPGQTGDCVVHDLKIRPNWYINVSNSGVGPDGVRKFVNGRGRWVEIPSGKIEIKYGGFSPLSNYQILDTDYVGYALIHTCSVVLGAWTKEDTQALVRFPTVQNTKLYNRQSEIIS